MPEISEKELERYKRIEDAVRDLVSEYEIDERRYPMHSGLVKALKPVSNRPTAEELLGGDRVAVAIKVLEALRNECMEQGVESKVQAIINKWIEEYKAER